MGGVGNGAAEDDWHWDLNPGEAAKRHLFGTTGVWGTTWLGQRRTPDFYFFFSEIGYPGLGRGGRKDCAFVGILKDFEISMKTLSHYS